VKSIFSRPQKYSEFGKNVHKLMKKLENSKFSHFFIQIFFFTADDSFGNGFRIVFHEYNFGKMKIFSFNTEKVLKKYGNGFENVCKPCNYEKNSCVII